MEKISFNVGKDFCGECSLALRRFIGHMDGVESVDLEEGGIAVVFDREKITKEELCKMTMESIEKLGYRMEQDGKHE